MTHKPRLRLGLERSQQGYNQDVTGWSYWNMNSEPSRLDQIEALVHSNAQAIAGLAAASAEQRAETAELRNTIAEAAAEQRAETAELRNTIASLTQMMQVATEERAELRNHILEVAHTQQRMAEHQEQLAERQRENDERFNSLLEEVRFLSRRLNNNPPNGQ